MGLVLRNVSWMDGGREQQGDIRLTSRRITDGGARVAPRRTDTVLEFGDHWALPGLINAHDHLGLDLLPRLGNPPYTSFYDWAEEIYRPEESPIAELQQIPIADRLAWGAWRNIFGGATSVAHHDPWQRRVFQSRQFPVTVVKCAWAHSLGFEDDVAGCYRSDRPFVLHAAEGADQRAAGEVAELDALGVLRDNTVLIHAMAVDDNDIDLFARRNAKVVWCPVSNQALYGATAPVTRLLAAGVTVALGTDSTISGAATLLDELRAASATGETGVGNLLGMVTHQAAAAFGLPAGHGTLDEGAPADVVVVPRCGSAPDSLLAADTADLSAVVGRGRVLLAEPDVAAAAELGNARITVGGDPMWIDDRFLKLRARIEAALGEDFPYGGPWAAIAPTEATS